MERYHLSILSFDALLWSIRSQLGRGQAGGFCKLKVHVDLPLQSERTLDDRIICDTVKDSLKFQGSVFASYESQQEVCRKNVGRYERKMNAAS
jgi:hypothetical protein